MSGRLVWGSKLLDPPRRSLIVPIGILWGRMGSIDADTLPELHRLRLRIGTLRFLCVRDEDLSCGEVLVNRPTAGA